MCHQFAQSRHRSPLGENSILTGDVIEQRRGEGTRSGEQPTKNDLKITTFQIVKIVDLGIFK